MLISMILIIFGAILISLFAGLFFLFQDKKNTKNLLLSLSFRVSLTLLLLILVTYGLYNGDIGNKAPWGQDTPHLNEINENK